MVSEWYFSLRMRGRNIFIAFIFVVAVIAVILYVKNRSKISPKVNPTATPSIQTQIEGKFKGLIIPTDAEKIDLKDVSGGSGMGLATRNEILADLPVLPSGQFYQGWLENASGKTALLGTLKSVKGGWILNYNSSVYPGYNKVVVMVGEKHILEGSF